MCLLMGAHYVIFGNSIGNSIGNRQFNCIFFGKLGKKEKTGVHETPKDHRKRSFLGLGQIWGLKEKLKKLTKIMIVDA